MNDNFDQLSLQEKRVAVAQDVIDRLQQEQYIAEKGSWVFSYSWSLLDHDLDVKTLLVENKVQGCGVCALGGLLLSCIAYKNDVTVEGVLEVARQSSGSNDFRSYSASKHLKELFEPKQLELIETAYEGASGFFYNRFKWDEESESLLTEKEFKTALNFYGSHNVSNKARLTLIMANIIANNGEFVPEGIQNEE